MVKVWYGPYGSYNKLSLLVRYIFFLGTYIFVVKKKYHVVGTVPKSIRKIKERTKIDTPNKHIYDLSLSWLGTDTSVKNGEVKLV